MIIDGESFVLSARGGKAEMLYQPAENPDIILETSYEALLSLGEGEMDQGAFSQRHSSIDIKTPGKDAEFNKLLSDALARFSN